MTAPFAAFLIFFQGDVLKDVRQAHARLATAAVSVSVETQTANGTNFSHYSIWTAGKNKFRIDFTPIVSLPFAPATILVIADGRTVQAYDAVSNRVVRSSYSAKLSPTANAATVMGETDPLMAVYLEPAAGLQGFLSQFGKLESVRKKVEDGTNVFTANFGRGMGSLALTADARTNLLRRVQVSGTGGSANWSISPSAIPVPQALAFEIPANADVVASLRSPPSKMTFGTADAQTVVKQSKSAYDNLRSVSFRVEDFVFQGGSESRRLAEGWWQREGSYKFAEQASSPKRRHAAMFRNNTLAIWTAGSKRVLKQKANAKEARKILDKMRIPLEPLLTALIYQRRFWRQFETMDTAASLLPQEQLVGGKKCKVLWLATADGWDLRIFVRVQDGLIARIERKNRAFGETALYTYTSVNEPMPAKVWKLVIPASTPSDRRQSASYNLWRSASRLN